SVGMGVSVGGIVTASVTVGVTGVRTSSVTAACADEACGVLVFVGSIPTSVSVPPMGVRLGATCASVDTGGTGVEVGGTGVTVSVLVSVKGNVEMRTIPKVGLALLASCTVGVTVGSPGLLT